MHKFYLLIFILSHTMISAQSALLPELPQRPRHVLDTAVEFNGWENDPGILDDVQEVRIGIFVGDDAADFVSRSAVQGAQLAIDEINALRGKSDIPFRLIHRWQSDPWKGAAKELINLVYFDSVVAIIGSTDGNTTHIAEQIATKAWIPLLSPVSADPTLNRIRIPWIFRLPPDYSVQARLIINTCMDTLALTKTGLITSTDHDGRAFASEILNAFADRPASLLFHFSIPAAGADLNEIITRCFSYSLQSLIIHLPSNILTELLNRWPASARDVVVFLPWLPGIRSDDLESPAIEKLYVVSPFSAASNPAYHAFLEKYSGRFGEKPSATAAYTYDTVNLLRFVVHSGSYDRINIRKALAGIHDMTGVTGPITWDNSGANISSPVLIELKKESTR